MQLETPKCYVERDGEPVGHVAAAGERRERIVAEVGALERVADDLRKIVDADERAINVVQDKETGMVRLGAAVAIDVCREFGARRGRLRPMAVQLPARARSGEKRCRIRLSRGTEVYAESGRGARGIPRWHNADSTKRQDR